jgi:hypothetical protein
MTNYRPTSLLTSFSEFVDKVIYARLHQHTMSNNILANEQYGFRSNSSTKIIKILVGGIFCDFKKAFGCVTVDLSFYYLK